MNTKLLKLFKNIKYIKLRQNDGGKCKQNLIYTLRFKRIWNKSICENNYI